MTLVQFGCHYAKDPCVVRGVSELNFDAKVAARLKSEAAK
jgi:hypothetical protein